MVALHAVVGNEVLLRVCDDLAVRRMVDRLDTDDAGLELRAMFERVAHELKLRDRRTDDEDAVRALDGVCDGLEEVM